MFSFEIGQRESGFYSERTDRITDSVRIKNQTESCQHPVPYYNIDIESRQEKITSVVQNSSTSRHNAGSIEGPS